MNALARFIGGFFGARFLLMALLWWFLWVSIITVAEILLIAVALTFVVLLALAFWRHVIRPHVRPG